MTLIILLQIEMSSCFIKGGMMGFQFLSPVQMSTQSVKKLTDWCLWSSLLVSLRNDDISNYHTKIAANISAFQT